MTAHQLLQKARTKYPNERFALDSKNEVLGQWSNLQQRFVAIACLSITGQWVHMPYEIKVNGALPEYVWIEATTAASIPTSIGV
jgi:hypothetical protein